MSRTTDAGRLGNHIIRNIAASFVAEKHNLHISYTSDAIIKKLGIPLFCGIKTYQSTVDMNNDNYFTFLDSDSLNSNIVANDYFQTREITNKIYKFIQSIKSEISIANQYCSRYMTNNDCFLHIRLGDVPHLNVGFDYYDTALSRCLPFDTLYISSDSPSHEIVQRLSNKYKNSEIIQKDEIDTIHFGSTCRHVVLSHGSFSAIIGYFSFYSDIYYPDYALAPRSWHGDMFSVPGWNCITI